MWEDCGGVSDCEELVFWRTLHIPLFGGFCNNMEFYLEELGQGSRIIWQGFY